MKKIIVFITIFVSFVTLSVPNSFAAQEKVAATNSHSGANVLIPEKALEVAPGVFSLGSAIDPETGELVEGYSIIHYKNNQAKPQGGSKPGATQCYTYLASGSKWKTVEPWIVNAQNTSSLDQTFVFNSITNNIAKWEDASDGIVGNGLGINILGNGTNTTAALSADTISPDGQNEVVFGAISDSNTIGVTIVWGIFSGPTANRKLVEWDQVYNDVNYDWSASGEVGKMDFENIATHELGHAVGLADLYTTSCLNETMYGYASEGTINKRTLEIGDITGINNLY